MYNTNSNCLSGEKWKNNKITAQFVYQIENPIAAQKRKSKKGRKTHEKQYYYDPPVIGGGEPKKKEKMTTKVQLTLHVRYIIKKYSFFPLINTTVTALLLCTSLTDMTRKRT